ncbi:unnamed protein product [Caenorhabditis nigoni]
MLLCLRKMEIVMHLSETKQDARDSSKKRDSVISHLNLHGSLLKRNLLIMRELPLAAFETLFCYFFFHVPHIVQISIFP